ncbi:MAG: cupin domain-containing protein [Anaerolineales bacterium]|nr:cupin domain-containing protein [Anaerolineales bacterium]
MPRQLFTAEDIRRLARDSATLVLGPDDIVTDEAADVAFALGVRLIRETETSSALRVEAGPGLHPLKVVRGASVQMERFLEGVEIPGTNTRLKDVITTGDRGPMGAGFMALEAPPGGVGQMAWTLNYDEIDIVLEGELIITRGNEQVRGGPGDVIYIPKGSSITFGTPSRTRFVYVVFPVNWNEK